MAVIAIFFLYLLWQAAVLHPQTTHKQLTLDTFLCPFLVSRSRKSLNLPIWSRAFSYQRPLEETKQIGSWPWPFSSVQILLTVKGPASLLNKPGKHRLSFTWKFHYSNFLLNRKISFTICPPQSLKKACGKTTISVKVCFIIYLFRSRTSETYTSRKQTRSEEGMFLREK